ncbi:MAG: hypothetical protein BJ554DRAFT_5838, partial [Olpidium bornovanus]
NRRHGNTVEHGNNRDRLFYLDATPGTIDNDDGAMAAHEECGERPTTPSSVRADQLPLVDPSKRDTALGYLGSSPTSPPFAASASFQGARRRRSQAPRSQGSRRRVSSMPPPRSKKRADAVRGRRGRKAAEGG